MRRYQWSRNQFKLDRYAEYFVKMEFILSGFDVYSNEVDNQGIDFIVRAGINKYYDIQVKSVRNYNNIYFPKDKFSPRENLYAAVVHFIESEPPFLYLIPSLVWNNPDDIFIKLDYEGLSNKPEWGINLSREKLPLLEQYIFTEIVEELKNNDLYTLANE